MSDPEVKALSLFFFFTILDEARALQAAALALEAFHRQRIKNPNLKSEVLIVQVCQKTWNRLRPKIQRGRPQFSLESGWMFPDQLDLGAWKEFQKKSPEEELLALVWSKILKISDEDISQGLQLTVGTVRFRVSHSLRRLSSYQNLFVSSNLKRIHLP